MRLSCRKASRLISDGLDRPLTRYERVSLGFHLLMCGNCRRFRQQMQILRDGIRQGKQGD